MRLRKDFLNIVGIFLIWRFYLIIISLFAINFVPLGYKDRFLGGGFDNYAIAPQIFGWANFDGEHYLSIATFGYKNLEQAFFPIYPAIISYSSRFLRGGMINYLLYPTLVGMLISSISTLLALVLLFDLISMDFTKKIAYLTLLLVLLFPTSFYLSAVYTESLFLFLSVAAFYSARKNKWLLAGLLGALASGTRVSGVLLLPALLIEAYSQKRSIAQIIGIIMIPMGFFGYMYYQWITVGDPLVFLKLQTLVGEQRQSGIVPFPQTIFRYLNMLYTVDKLNPIYQTVVLEFISFNLSLVLLIYGYFKKIRLSYLVYTAMSIFIASAQGSFTSFPRYLLVIFPSFLILSIFINNQQKLILYGVAIISAILLCLEASLFLRGYWIA